jgi:hypothetical protein
VTEGTASVGLETDPAIFKLAQVAPMMPRSGVGGAVPSPAPGLGLLVLVAVALTAVWVEEPRARR